MDVELNGRTVSIKDNDARVLIVLLRNFPRHVNWQSIAVLADMPKKEVVSSLRRLIFYGLVQISSADEATSIGRDVARGLFSIINEDTFYAIGIIMQHSFPGLLHR